MIVLGSPVAPSDHGWTERAGLIRADSSRRAAFLSSVSFKLPLGTPHPLPDAIERQQSARRLDRIYMRVRSIEKNTDRPHASHNMQDHRSMTAGAHRSSALLVLSMATEYISFVCR